MNKVIVKIRMNKQANQMLLTVPKQSGFRAGEYVEIIKLKLVEDNQKD